MGVLLSRTSLFKSSQVKSTSEYGSLSDVLFGRSKSEKLKNNTQGPKALEQDAKYRLWPELYPKSE